MTHNYYLSLPPNTRLGKISDFIEIGPDYPDYHIVKIGMKYILFSPERPDGTKEDRWYEQEITEITTSDKLDPWIKEGRLFVYV